MNEAGFSIRVEDEADATKVVRLAGVLRFRDAVSFWRDVRSLPTEGTRRFRIDVSDVELLDGGVAALLVEWRTSLLLQGKDVSIDGARGSTESILDLYQDRARPSDRPERTGVGSVLDEIGQATWRVSRLVYRAIEFVGEMTAAIVGAVRTPRSVPWGDVAKLAERSGADGLGIVILINFLIGLVTGFQAALQLKQFGANIYVANLVGLAMVREMGPLMTAIIVTGRSGAGFAAELGTMKVSEEVDALRTLGLSPYRYLAIPRIIALVLTMPLLVLFADLFGILGGLIIAVTNLDLTVQSFFLQAQKAVSLWDLASGLIKSIFFAAAIALIACERGLAAHGGAEGVGRSTTSAVVSTLFSLVVIDAIFTTSFGILGL